jgi:hypothetical protein
MSGVFGVGSACPPRPLHLGIGKNKSAGVSASSHNASNYADVFRSRDLGAAWLTGNAASSDTARMVSTTPVPTLSVGNLHGNNPRPSKGQGG